MKTILLVEDDDNQRLLFKEELMDAGYNVVVAVDGPQALREVDEQMPDMVVLDIRMPGMNGIEVVGKLLAKNNRLPVVLDSAYGMYRANFMTWPADAYVLKSSDISKFIKTVNEVFEKRLGST